MYSNDEVIKILLNNGISKFSYYGVNHHCKAVFKQRASSRRYLLKDGDDIRLIDKNIGQHIFETIGEFEIKLILFFLKLSPTQFKRLTNCDKFNLDQITRNIENIRSMVANSENRKTINASYRRRIESNKDILDEIDNFCIVPVDHF